MDWLWQDARFGFRTILKDRGFSFAAVLALALGIGSSTAIFSVIDNVLLQPFPYADGNRLFDVRIHDSAAAPSQIRNSFSIPEFLDYQQQNDIFDRTMGVWEVTALMGGPSAPEPLDADLVTANTFDFLGVPPLLGRGILPRDAQPGAPPVFVLSYKVWVKRFGLDRSIVGKTFILNDKPTTLVGIMPPRFAFWSGDIWMPASLDRADPDAARRFFVLYGHLKPGLDPKAAEADLRILAERFSKIYRGSYPKQFDVHLMSLVEVASGRIRNTLFTLLAAVGLLLLIACANVANLLLAKSAAREKELALRLTLGAGRFRIVRQLIVESLLLALAGAAVGCFFALAGLKGLIALLPQFTFPDEAVIGENIPVLLATVAITVLTAVLFGLAPSLAASRRDLNEPLKTGGRGNTGFRRGRLRNVLIVAEVALSLLLLTASGLLMRSFFLQRAADLGIRTDHVLLTELNLPATRYKTTDSQTRFLRELIPRVERLPGVISVAAALDFPPFGGVDTDFDVAGITHSQRWLGGMVPASWQLFQTLRLRLVQGRLLTPADENGKRKVVVINQTLAARYFGRRNPIGSQLQLAALKTAPEPVANPWFEIVGVVSDVKNRGIREAVAPEAYLPYTVAAFGRYNLFVRTLANPASLSLPLTDAVLSLDRQIIPRGTETMDDLFETSQYARPRFGLILFSVFAAIGLALVSVGVYSVISYTVSQQRHEIGIRMALGATAGDVRSLVVVASLQVILIGVGIGLLFAFLVARVLASQLWGVPWYDPATLLSVIALLTSVGLGASYLPSIRATRVDPAICLRHE
jgi:putative ABC transport system permease protein